jgi:hypothetical protein
VKPQKGSEAPNLQFASFSGPFAFFRGCLLSFWVGLITLGAAVFSSYAQTPAFEPRFRLNPRTSERRFNVILIWQKVFKKSRRFFSETVK